MLGDNPEKSKNPLKKAMRRRNAKTVQFTAPTYYEASDVEYSSDEEGEEGADPEFETVASAAVDQLTHEGHDQSAAVEPLKVGVQQEQTDIDDVQSASFSQEDDAEPIAEVEKPRSSEEIFDRAGIFSIRLDITFADLVRRCFIQQIQEGYCSEHRFFLQGRYRRN